MRRAFQRPMATMALLALLCGGLATQPVHQAALGEPGQKTPEASTEDVRRALADGSQNVSYFPGTFEELAAALRAKHGGM